MSSWTQSTFALITLLAVGCTPSPPVEGGGSSTDDGSTGADDTSGTGGVDSSSTGADDSSSTGGVDSSSTGADDSSSTGSETAGVEPPIATVLELSFSQVKQFDFSWVAADGADYYQLLESASPGDPFVQLGDDIVGESISIAMPLHFRFEASYALRACNAGGCATSAPVDVVGPLAEAVGYFKPSNTDADDFFGVSIGLSDDGNTLAVGANREDSGAGGIDGDHADDSAADSGAVYVFVRDPTGQWSQQAYFKASNPDSGDEFGWALALSGDGDTLAVGAHHEDSSAAGIGGAQADDSSSDPGAVYVFVRGAVGQWSQQAYVKASNPSVGDEFGTSVALSDDGDTLAVGADWEDSGATGIDGDQADESVYVAGAVYVFVRDATDQWSQQVYVKASNAGMGDHFGSSVALSGDGNTLAVGADHEDSTATGIGGNQASDGMAASGAVYVFVRGGVDLWSQQAYIKASNTGAADYFGRSVVLSDDGSTLAVGATHEDSNADGIDGDQSDGSAGMSGAVYVFVRGAMDVWTQQAYVKASNSRAGDRFGFRIALSGGGNVLAVGAASADGNAAGIEGDQADASTVDSGAAYVLVRDAMDQWSQHAYVKASNPGPTDFLGIAVALSDDGSTLAVGAAAEASNATGIGGDQADDSAPYAGAVYLF